MRCEENCVSGTVMMPAQPGKTFGYLVLCPTCKGKGATRFACETMPLPHPARFQAAQFKAAAHRI